MSDNKLEIKKGIKFHEIETNKFKTNLFAIFLSMPLNRETVTKNALLTAVLRRGTKNFESQELISKNLEEMYGAEFDCGIEKSGDFHNIKFYLEVINDQFLPKKENLSKNAIEMLLEIAFNPLVENGAFKEEYVVGEKENLKQIIEGKIDNKGSYALERCIEEMYKDMPYGLYKYGYIEDLEKISSKELYEYYLEMLKDCKIDIFASGDEIEDINQVVENNENIEKLQERDVNLDIEMNNNPKYEPQIINENMDVTQGKIKFKLHYNGI